MHRCSGIRCPVLHRVMGSGQKSFKLMFRGHQLLSYSLVNDHTPRVSRHSSLSANERSYNEQKLGTVHRSPSTYIKIEENLGKP
jgi:hypothetical protein